VWADVDTVVACYNVRAYQAGVLETVDISHLQSLSDGAVPYIAELTQDHDQAVANRAKAALSQRERRTARRISATGTSPMPSPIPTLRPMMIPIPHIDITRSDQRKFNEEVIL
jgi:predicted P-loop ATPase/GTPase